MKRYSLSRRLLVILTCIGILLALVVPFAGLLNEYYVARRLIRDQTHAVETSSLPVLAHLVWTVNETQTEQVLQGMVAQPTVTAVVLRTDESNVLRLEEDIWDSQRDTSTTWPVVYPREDTVFELGELKIWTRSPWAIAWSLEPLGLGLIVGLISVAILSTGLAVLIRATVTAPLVRLATDVHALTSTGTLPPEWNAAIARDRGEETYRVRRALDHAITARIETEERLAASLREKEVLLQEVHHRVKNNLQIISSMLALQQGTVTDPTAERALDDSRHRVMSMALVHELLYQGSTADRVQLDEYLRNLAAAMDAVPGTVEISVDAPTANVTIDTAIPTGLIVTELITNAVKHAFSDTRRGTITVGAAWEAAGALRITVADDGKGLPQDWSVERTDSLGMSIVTALASQLRTELSVESGPGARFSFVILSSPPTSGSEPVGESVGRTPDSPPHEPQA
ncbi:MAG: sensor histidine kinase [Alkalispirochaeta sp.]